MSVGIDTFPSGFPVPTGLISGRFLLVDSCLVFEAAHDRRRYRPVLPTGSRLAKDADKVVGVSVGDERVSTGQLVTAGGGVSPWSRGSDAPGCPNETIIIGKIINGVSS